MGRGPKSKDKMSEYGYVNDTLQPTDSYVGVEVERAGNQVSVDIEPCSSKIAIFTDPFRKDDLQKPRRVEARPTSCIRSYS